jgi:hypothetical protein
LAEWTQTDYQQVLDRVSLNEIRERCWRLDRLIRKNASFQKILPAAESLVHLIAEGFPQYKETALYRGRVWQNGSSLPANVQELLAPPPQYVKQFGRLNRPGESILYTSETTHTVIKELGAQAGDRAVLLQLTARQGAKNLNLSRLGIFPSLKGHTENVDEVLPLYRMITGSQKNLNKVNRIRKYLSELLRDRRHTGSNKNYIATAAISSIILGEDNVHGIIYPSVQIGDTACNVALRPDVVSANFTPDKVVYIELNEVEKYRHRADCLHTGWIDAAGNIVWDDSVTMDTPKLLPNRGV